MKKIIAVLMILTAGFAVFASGSQEADDNDVVRLTPGTMARNGSIEDLEEIELTGVVKFESAIPELTVNGTDYTLMTPGMHEYAGYIKEGDSVVVTGYVMEEDQAFPGSRGGRMYGESLCYSLDVLEGNTVVLVETVEIDGVTYELPWAGDDYGFMGRSERGGMMPGRGDGGRGFSGPGRFNS